VKEVVFAILLPFLFSGVCWALGEKVLLVVADNYRDEEFEASYSAVKEAGLTPVIASKSKGTLKGMLGGKTQAELALKDVDPSSYKAVIFVGGVGASVFWDDPDAHRIAKEVYSKGKPVCAICIAPVTLAKAGLLKGVKATSWPSVAQDLRNNGAIYVDSPVIEDKGIITANGPQAAIKFKEAIVKKLKGI